MAKITFVKEKKTIEVEPGTKLRTAAMHNGVEVYAGIHKVLNCHGLAQCGSCVMRITKGQENVTPPGLWERLRMLLWRLGNENLRLSCQCRVNGDIEVESTPSLNWHGERFWG